MDGKHNTLMQDGRKLEKVVVKFTVDFNPSEVEKTFCDVKILETIFEKKPKSKDQKKK